MERSIRVHLVPDLVSIQDLAGQVVVVVDVLRATTTLACALEAGAEKVQPCLEVAEARELAQVRRLAGEQVLLGGERGGEPIAGFDLGNSPLEYTAETVGGRALIFTTTNGTRALMRCIGAERVLLGSLVNRAAVLRAIQGKEQVHILCAGTDGEPSWEDTLFAGAIVDAWCSQGEASQVLLNDAARMAWRGWQSIRRPEGNASEGLVASLRLGAGGSNLIRIGRAADIDFAARLDIISTVPELMLSEWWIRPCKPGGGADGP
jgi:2-phosphosulfolactate phosphatase